MGDLYLGAGSAASILLIGMAIALLWLTPRPALACAVCSCGDPTLTAMGAEKPFQNRLRASLEARHRTDTVGIARLNEMSLSEQRLDARLAWAPTDRIFLLASLPLLRREIEYVNLARHTATGVGDLELHARFFVLQDREFAPRHLVSLLAGMRFPTSPLQRGTGGDLLPLELQSGAGSFDPAVGLAYAFFDFPWSVYASGNFTLPTEGIEGIRASRSLGLTSALQYQLRPSLGLRGGFDARIEDKTVEGGERSPDSGGWIAFGTAELLYSPLTDVMLYGSARLPVFNALDGRHVEGPIFGAGVAYDF